MKKDEERQAESLAQLEEGAAAIDERMAEAAGACGPEPAQYTVRADLSERQRKKSQASGKALSKEELDQYRDLSVQPSLPLKSCRLTDQPITSQHSCRVRASTARDAPTRTEDVDRFAGVCPG